MGLSGTKHIATLNDPIFYKKIMQKYQTGKNNTSRIPTMIFYKGKESISPQKIYMTLKFSFQLNQQNIVPLLILKYIPDLERTLSRLRTERKTFQSVLKLKNAQGTHFATKTFLSPLINSKDTQGYSVISEHLLTGNFFINKTSVFSFLTSLNFTAESIISNLSKIAKIPFLPQSNPSSQQNTYPISTELLTFNSKIFPPDSKVLNCDKKMRILSFFFLAPKNSYMRLDTSRKPTSIYNESALKYFPLLDDKLPSNYLPKKTFTPSLSASNIFYQPGPFIISPDYSVLNSRTFAVYSKVLNYEKITDILNSQISRTEKGYTFLNLIKKFVFNDNEPISSYLHVLKDKLSSSYLLKKTPKHSFTVKNINIVKEIFSQSDPEKNGLQVLSKPTNALNKTDIANVIQVLPKVSKEYSIARGYSLALNTINNQIKAFLYFRSLISRSVNLVNTLNKIIKLSFLPVNNAFYSRKKSTVFSGILALNPKIVHENELFISSKKAHIFTIFKKYTKRFLNFQFSTASSYGTKMPNNENNLKILNSQRFGEIIYLKALNFAKSLTFIYKENKVGCWSVFKNKSLSRYSGEQNISSILTVKNLPFIKETLSRLNTEKISLQKIVNPEDAQKRGEAFNLSQAIFKISRIYPIRSATLSARHTFTNMISIFSFPGPEYEMSNEISINSEKAGVLSVINKYIERFSYFRRMATHTLTHTQNHNLFPKSLIFKPGDKVINLNRIVTLPYSLENSIFDKPVTRSICTEAEEFSSSTFSYNNNRKILNSRAFKVNKYYSSLNVTKYTDFININSTIKNQFSTVKNQLVSGNKLHSVIFQDNLSSNKIYSMNKRFFKESDHIIVNKPFIKNSYVHFKHETPDYILSKYNSNIGDESLVLHKQGHIEQEIGRIKTILIETKKSISEKKVPVFEEADIRKYIDINRISSQVYQNIERTIRMERERRGV